jgi:hypothetical protein
MVARPKTLSRFADVRLTANSNRLVAELHDAKLGRTVVEALVNG